MNTYTEEQMNAITFAMAQAAATAAAEYVEPSDEEKASEFLFGYNRADDIKIVVLTAANKAANATMAALGFVAAEYVD